MTGPLSYYGPHAHCAKCGMQAAFIWDSPDAYALPLICRYCRAS